jgi:hypothetical protein
MFTPRKLNGFTCKEFVLKQANKRQIKVNHRDVWVNPKIIGK